MKCTNCGAEIADGAKFCGACGTAAPTVEATPETVIPAVNEEVVEAVTETTPKAPCKVKQTMASLGEKVKAVMAPVAEKCKPFIQKNKLWIAGGACLAILLLTVLVIVSACNQGNGFIAYEHAINATVEEGQVYVQYDNKKIVKTNIEAESIRNRQYSLDGNILTFLTNEGQLVVVKGKKATVVASDVTDYILSVNGEGIGFITRNDDDEYALKLLKVGKKKAKTVMAADPGDFEISPDGKSMIYLKVDEEGDKTELMYFNGSKSKKITSNEVKLVGLSNKGKQIYVVSKNDEGENVLFSYNTRGNKKKVGNCSTYGFAFNADHTQVLFFDGNLSWSSGMEAKTFISTKGKEAVRISSSYAIPLYPNSSDVYSNDHAATFPAENLYNQVYTCYKDGQYNLWLIKKNVDNSKKLASNVSDATLDESAKYVYYTDKDNDLKVVKISHGDRASDKAKLIAEDVENFVVTSDRAKVYFIAEDALYSVNGKTGRGKKTIASENVGYSLALNQKDICYYFVDGDVYACSNGKRGKQVVADAEDIDVTPNGIVYVETEDAVYATKTAKKPAKIYTFD